MAGFLMLEVLLSMSLIAFVLLSLLIYQVNLLKNTESLTYQIIATQQLLDFSEILCVEKTDSVRQRFFSSWEKNNVAWLPNGSGHWNESENNNCIIYLSWFFKKTYKQKMHVYCVAS